MRTRFKLSKALDPTIMIDARDQPRGFLVVALQARGCAVEHEFADCLDEEVSPFLAAFIKRIVEREERLGLSAVEHAVAPALAAQREHFVRRNAAVLRGALGKVDKMRGHGVSGPS